jgi:glyoxylase-like metal-dependent hydrolase (beta-lactamase superfamily II)
VIDHVTTRGTFTLDGQDFEVENNVWLIGDDTEVLVIDAAHDARPIAEAVGNRRCVAIAATHGHNDHINVAGELADLLGAPIWIHPDDLMLWEVVYPSRAPGELLVDGQWLSAGSAMLQVFHTPGHSPGGCCFYDADEGVLFSGDTLFQGGPGATGRSYSDFPTIIESIRTRLLTLPPETKVLPGHGAATTVGEEAPHLPEWIARGH